MKLLPRTLGGQLLALLLAALGVSLAVSVVIYSQERTDAVREADRSALIEMIGSVVRILREAPADLRAEMVEAASTPRARVWISDESPVPSSQAAPESRAPTPLLPLFQAPIPEPPRIGVIERAETTPVPADQFFDFLSQRPPPPAADLLVSVPFADGSGWVNAQTMVRGRPVSWAWPVILSTALMAIATLLIIAVTTRRAIRPLKILVARADALGRGAAGPPIPERGPEEVRRVTASFNRMQERLGRFVADRTRMIAAIGHDLRTPITSLKLRAELLDDDETRSKMLATLEDMQNMVEATLSFARQEAVAEPARPVDLVALVATVVDEQADVGANVEFLSEIERLPCRCRPTALRRAVGNLIENAVQYAGKATVRLDETATGAVIAVEDEGPGIPADRLDEVFQPFVRLEASRSRSTGGVGLGLSIARSIVLAHGGELVLANRSGGGLRAEIRLPTAEPGQVAKEQVAELVPAAP